MKRYSDFNNNELMDSNNQEQAHGTAKTNMLKKSVTFGLCALLAGGLALGSYQGGQALASKEVLAAETGSLDVSDIVEKAMPSIVSITTKSVQELQNYYGLFGGYGGYAPSYKREVQGGGSGIIIGKNDDELLIATNYHVVKDAENISIAFVDNEAYEAKVKGSDEGRDLAVVSIKLDDISDDTLSAINVAKIGSSDDLKVGEQVVAIGNAMGYGQSVTTGIVSAKNRSMNSESGQMQTEADSNDGVNLIQTDAAINPGNSGGALLNMDGEVVGINSAKLASTAVEGMGYAIAISDVKDVLTSLMTEESRDALKSDEHGVLGIVGGTVSSTDSAKYGFPQGVFVSQVNEGGAAEKAGIVKNSVITEFNSKSVQTIQELIDYLTYYKPGEEVQITFAVSDNGEFKEKTVTVTLGEQKKDSDESTDEDSEIEEPEIEDGDSDEAQDDESQDSDSQDDNRSREDIFEDWGEGLFGWGN